MPAVAGTPDRRLDRWLNLAPKASRELAAAVRAEVVVPLSAQGFSWVARHHYDPDPEPNSAREILLERRDADDIEAVILSFDKYRRPRLQVRLMRRSAEPPHNWIRAANLVRHHRQSFYFWGKPWWMPSALWPHTAGLRTAKAIRLRLPAALAFLGQGKNDRCIAASDLQMLTNHQRLAARTL